MTRANVAFYSAVLVAAATLTIGAYGWTGKSIAWIIVLLVLMLVIENLPEKPSPWRWIRLSTFTGLIAGWAIVFFFLRG